MNVTLHCDEKGCPRKKKVDFDLETMPRGTAHITSSCPWHMKDGHFYEEVYCDKDWNGIEADTGTGQ